MLHTHEARTVADQRVRPVPRSLGPASAHHLTWPAATTLQERDLGVFQRARSEMAKRRRGQTAIEESKTDQSKKIKSIFERHKIARRFNEGLLKPGGGRELRHLISNAEAPTH